MWTYFGVLIVGNEDAVSIVGVSFYTSVLANMAVMASYLQVVTSSSIYFRIHDRRLAVAVCVSLYFIRKSVLCRDCCSNARLFDCRCILYVVVVHVSCTSGVSVLILYRARWMIWLFSYRQCCGFSPRLPTIPKVGLTRSKKRFGANRNPGRQFFYVNCVFIF